MSKKVPARIPWSHEWASATESFLQNPLGPHSREEVRHLATAAMLANDARQLGRFIGPIGQERRWALLKILTSPRHLQKIAEKAKRHKEIWAAL